MVAAVRDITERKAAQAAEAQLAAIVESSADGIFSMSDRGVITSWNPGAETIFGFSRTDVVGHHVGLYFPDDPVLEELLDSALRRVSPSQRPAGQGAMGPRSTWRYRCRRWPSATRPASRSWCATSVSLRAFGPNATAFSSPQTGNVLRGTFTTWSSSACSGPASAFKGCLGLIDNHAGGDEGLVDHRRPRHDDKRDKGSDIRPGIGAGQWG